MLKNCTIITPVWAKEQSDVELLGECLESSVRQAPVIVYNDGSLASLARLERQFSSVLFVHDTHHGKAHARNGAVQHAETELIYPLDADDWISPGTLDHLESLWQGVPLYSWIWKWYSITEQELHRLPEFTCNRTRHSIASVNVLHSKEQWGAVGGWDERYNLYEDWLYNGKLFHLFCAQLVSEPFVFYRQHPRQSTKQVQDENRIRKLIRKELADYVKEDHTMACCGKAAKNRSLPQRTPKGTKVPISFSARTPGPPPRNSSRFGAMSALPAANSGQIVSARYVGGKGRGAHIYRDPDTRHAYRVKHGQTLQVDITDTTTDAAHTAGQSRKMLIRATPVPVVAAPPPAPAPPPPAPIPEPIPEPVPEPDQITAVVTTDLAPMPGTIAQIKLAINEGISRTQAMVWLREEETKEKPRITAIKMLEKVVNG